MHESTTNKNESDYDQVMTNLVLGKVMYIYISYIYSNLHVYLNKCTFNLSTDDECDEML